MASNNNFRETDNDSASTDAYSGSGSTDVIDKSDLNVCREGPTIIETDLTLEGKTVILKLSSKVSVSKSQDLFLATQVNAPFVQLFEKCISK